MALYFAYNQEAKRPLRVQITEEEYIAALANPDRWFINFGNYVLEVSREEYVKYSKRIINLIDTHLSKGL